MEVTIDKFGRILIPKKIRKMLGIVPGQILELVANIEDRKLAIKPQISVSDMAVTYTSFGFPVIQNGETSEDNFDTVAFIKETREEYLDRKLNWDDKS